jgi:hypothetical protein
MPSSSRVQAHTQFRWTYLFNFSLESGVLYPVCALPGVVVTATNNAGNKYEYARQIVTMVSPMLVYQAAVRHGYPHRNI